MERPGQGRDSSLLAVEMPPAATLQQPGFQAPKIVSPTSGRVLRNLRGNVCVAHRQNMGSLMLSRRSSEGRQLLRLRAGKNGSVSSTVDISAT